MAAVVLVATAAALRLHPDAGAAVSRRAPPSARERPDDAFNMRPRGRDGGRYV